MLFGLFYKSRTATKICLKMQKTQARVKKLILMLDLSNLSCLILNKMLLDFQLRPSKKYLNKEISIFLITQSRITIFSWNASLI